MAIQLSNAESFPAVTYNKIHLTKLEIGQPVFENDNLSPVYTVNLFYRHYGVVGGIRYYKNEEVQRIGIQDYLTLAQSKAQAGDTSLLEALSSIEIAVAKIIEDQMGTPTSVV